MFCRSCMCPAHVVLAVPEVMFGSISGIGDGPDLSENIRPVQNYLLSSCAESKFFIVAASITECLEVLEVFAGRLWSLAKTHGFTYTASTRMQFWKSC